MKDENIIRNRKALTEIIRSLIHNQNELRREVNELKNRDKNRRIGSMTLSEKVKFIKAYGSESYILYMLHGIEPKGKIRRETKGRKHRKNKHVEGYLKTCQKLKKTEPTLEELKNNTEISTSIWWRLQNKDMVFLTQLCAGIEKRINRSRKNEVQEFWAACIMKPKNHLEKIYNKNYRQKRKPYDDNINTDSVDEFMRDRYGE
jgi:hypothetical protein